MAPALDELRALRLLGLPPGASAEEIRGAWLDLARVWHPDRFQNDERLRAKAGENLQRINDAYASLKDYDPARDVGLGLRVRESVAIMFGIGELGNPPPDSRQEPVVRAAAPLLPAGLRRSLAVLGLGVTSRLGERTRRSHAVALILGAMMILLVLLVGVALWLGGR